MDVLVASLLSPSVWILQSLARKSTIKQINVINAVNRKTGYAACSLAMASSNWDPAFIKTSTSHTDSQMSVWLKCSFPFAMWVMKHLATDWKNPCNPISQPKLISSSWHFNSPLNPPAPWIITMEPPAECQFFCLRLTPLWFLYKHYKPRRSCTQPFLVNDALHFRNLPPGALQETRRQGDDFTSIVVAAAIQRLLVWSFLLWGGDE